MADGAMPKPLADLLAVAVLCWVAGAMVLGWLNGRGRRGSEGGSPPDGWLGDDGPHHGVRGSGDADGDHHGDAGDAGH